VHDIDTRGGKVPDVELKRERRKKREEKREFRERKESN